MSSDVVAWSPGQFLLNGRRQRLQLEVPDWVTGPDVRPHGVARVGFLGALVDDEPVAALFDQLLSPWCGWIASVRNLLTDRAAPIVEEVGGGDLINEGEDPLAVMWNLFADPDAGTCVEDAIFDVVHPVETEMSRRARETLRGDAEAAFEVLARLRLPLYLAEDLIVFFYSGLSVLVTGHFPTDASIWVGPSELETGLERIRPVLEGLEARLGTTGVTQDLVVLITRRLLPPPRRNGSYAEHAKHLYRAYVQGATIRGLAKAYRSEADRDTIKTGMDRAAALVFDAPSRAAYAAWRRSRG